MIRVYATCTSCGQDDDLTEHDTEAAKDLFDALGWRDLDTTPLCPNCASWQGVRSA